MYLISKQTGEDAKKAAAEKLPFGPEFDWGVISRLETLEVWGTSFKDEGEDYCLFKAFDAAGQPIGQRRMGGY